MATDQACIHSLDTLKNTELVGVLIDRLNKFSKNFLFSQRILCKHLDHISLGDQRQIHELCVNIATAAEKVQSALASANHTHAEWIYFDVTAKDLPSVKKDSTDPIFTNEQAYGEVVNLFATLAHEFSQIIQELPRPYRHLPEQGQALSIPLSEIHLASNWTGLNLPTHPILKKTFAPPNTTYSVLMNSCLSTVSKSVEEKSNLAATVSFATHKSANGPEFFPSKEKTFTHAHFEEEPLQPHPHIKPVA